MLLDLLRVASGYNPIIERRDFYPSTPAIELMQREPEPNRMLISLPNVGGVYGLSSVTGDDAMTPRVLERLVDTTRSVGIYGIGALHFTEPLDSPILDVLGVRHVIAPPGRMPPGRGFRRVYDGPDASVHRNEDAFPPAYLAATSISCVEDEQALARVREDGAGLRNRAVVHTCDPLPEPSEAPVGSATLTRPRPGEIRIVSDASAPTVLVVTEGWDPGWRASVDGVERPVHRAQQALMAVSVPQGRHEVVLEYRPASFAWGALLGGVGLLALGLLLALGGRARVPRAASLGLLLALGCGGAESPDPRPNLLVILTDQQHAGMLSATGDPWLRTPAMDRIAARGVRFERAYTTHPECMPARVSLVTGHMPSRFGIRPDDGPRGDLPDADLERSLGRIFADAGYETVYGGKTDWLRNMTPRSLGFRMISEDRREGLAEAAVRFLREPHEVPFLLVLSFINPHDVSFLSIDDYTRAERLPPMYSREVEARRRLYAAMRLPEGLSREEFLALRVPPLPPNHEIPALEPAGVEAHYVDAFRRFARERWSEEQWRLYRYAYRRLTERVDAHVGKVLDALAESGLDARTLVVFSSDHGDLDGAHRLEHKSVPYEEAVRVPFIVRPPGAAGPGTVDRTHLVSVGLDLIPTLADYADIDLPEGLPGQSVRPLVEGRLPGTWRDQLVVESYAARMLRTDRYKYVVYPGAEPREQLTDLEVDPGEMDNRALDPEYEAILLEHRRRLRRWVEERGDAIGAPYVPAG